jgi:hypothetical protein
VTPEAGRGPRLTRRRLLTAGLVGGAVVAVGSAGRLLYVEPSGAWDPSRRRRPVFGMLQAEPMTYPDLREAGVEAVTLSLSWSDAEPDGPGLDEATMQEIEDRHRAAEDAGLEVA